MSTSERWLWAVAVMAIDFFVFFLPLTGMAVAYILIARPPWFRAWVDEFYGRT